jgi:hypothetical protein
MKRFAHQLTLHADRIAYPDRKPKTADTGQEALPGIKLGPELLRAATPAHRWKRTFNNCVRWSLPDLSVAELYTKSMTESLPQDYKSAMFQHKQEARTV